MLVCLLSFNLGQMTSLLLICLLPKIQSSILWTSEHVYDSVWTILYEKLERVSPCSSGVL